MPAPIVDEFDKYIALARTDGYGVKREPTDSDLEASAFNMYCADIAALIDARPDFFAKFDYRWAKDRSNYAQPIEAQLQHHLLRIISEIAVDHPDYEKLGDICVRVLASRHVNTEAVVRGRYKYIVISTSMIRTMQTWAVTIRGISAIGRRLDDNLSLICSENYLFGRDMEKAVRSEWIACVPFIDYMIDTCVSYRVSQIPELTFALRTEIDASSKRVAAFLLVGEMFFVCHELIHLLKHADRTDHRSEEEEIEADKWAASLFIIFQSALSEWHLTHERELSSMDLVELSAVMCGPAIFFSVMHALLIIEQTTVFQLDAGVPSEALNVIRREFNLNRARTLAYRDAIKTFGLDLFEIISQMNKSATPKAPAVSYANSLQQLDVVSVACRMRLVERLNVPVDISLERNLFRGFPAA